VFSIDALLATMQWVYRWGADKMWDKRDMLTFILAWMPMVVIAIFNGMLRVKWYGKTMNELAAHQISSLTGIFLFGIYIWIVIRSWPPDSAILAAAIGLVWLVLTIAFEFSFGRYVAGHTWRHLFSDYNLFDGRLWAIVLLWVTIAPYLFYQLMHR
jgi:hypothetical protein